ncbi:MAG: glycerophosphodiester phosphodiesterase family protein [Bdellovibrionota bacterium]
MKKLILCSFLFLGCTTPQKSFRAIGHRGSAGHAPENTMPALEAARRLQVHEIEIDIQLSADNQLVLFHDDKLDKKTSSKGSIRQHTASELKKVDIGGWYDKTYPNSTIQFKGTYLTTLDDVLKTYGRVFYYHIEIKSHEAEIPTLLMKMLKEQNQLENVTITSFDFDQIARVRTLDAKIPLCLLVKGAISADILSEIHRAKKAGFNQVAIDTEQINEEQVKLAHQLSLDIRGYGVKSKDHLKKLLALDVYGATLDNPNWVRTTQL